MSSDKLNEVMPFINAIKICAQDTNNEAAQQDLEPFLKDIGFVAPECYKEAVMLGWGNKYKGIYEICTTHFPDNDLVKDLYNEIRMVFE